MIDNITIQYIGQILLASCNTLYITICSIFVGMVFAIIFSLAKYNLTPYINKISKFIINFIISIPELVVLFGFYFGTSFLLTKFYGTYTELNNVIAGIITLAIIFASYATEVLYAAYLKINKEQIDTAKLLGLSNFTIGYKIIFPQLIKYSLYGLSNLSLILLKDTALLSLIGVNETLASAKIAASATYSPFFFYSIAAGIYLCFSACAEYFINKINNKQKW